MSIPEWGAPWPIDGDWERTAHHARRLSGPWWIVTVIYRSGA